MCFLHLEKTKILAANKYHHVLKSQVFLQVYRLSLFGPTQLNYATLKKYFENHSTVSKSVDEYFVSHYEIDSKNENFRFACTTKRLLELTMKTNIITIDATYKLIFEG